MPRLPELGKSVEKEHHAAIVSALNRMQINAVSAFNVEVGNHVDCGVGRGFLPQ
jgi:hypothetical protein